MPHFGVTFLRSYKVVKRESGVNPEQTRCCKLHQKAPNNTQTTVQ